MIVEKKLSKKAARLERKKSKVSALLNLRDQPEIANKIKSEGKEQSEPHTKKPRLEEDKDICSLKNQLKQRSNQNSPMFRLVHVGLSASLNLPKESRVPILASDVQAFLITSIAGETAFYQPYRWCTLSKWSQVSQTLVMIVEDVSVDDLENNSDIFSYTLKTFQDKVEMSCTKNEGYSLDFALAYVPISTGMKKQILKEYPSLTAAAQDKYIYGVDDSLEDDTKKTELNLEFADSSQIVPQVKEILGLNTEKESCSSPSTEMVTRQEDSSLKPQVTGNGQQASITESLSANYTDDVTKNSSKSCNRLDLLLSASQLLEEDYPLPGSEEFNTFKLTHEIYQPVTEKSPMFSIDCEWCTCIDGSYGLARVAVVDENFETCYHTYVKPDLEIVDYLTQFSGITEKTLENVKKNLADVQLDLQKLFPPDAILIGQSLQSDLKALKLIHPYIIDTSVIFNMTGVRTSKSKLKVLAAAFCNRRIQDSTNGHDPTEDAMAAMELVLLKLKMGIEFGDLAILRSRDRKKAAACDQESSIHMKLFTFIQTYNQGATLITSNPAIEKSYRPEQLKIKDSLIKNKKKKDPLAKPVEMFSAKDFQDAVRVTQESRLNNNFTLVHTSLGNGQPNTKENLKELEAVIRQTYEGISLNGMMVVILGGTTNCSQNGACLVRVKKTSI